MSDYVRACVCIVDVECREARSHIRVEKVFMILTLAMIMIITLPTIVQAQSPRPLQSLPQSVPLEDNLLARVNGMEVRQSDVLRMLEQLPAEVRNMPQGQLFTLLIERAVDRVLVIQAARTEGLADDPEIRVRVKQVEDDLLWARFLERKVAEGMTESRIRKAYDRLVGEAAEEEIKARHILLASEEEAKAIIRDLQGGADFEDLARENSIGPSRETGGDLGFFNRSQMVSEFSDAAFAMDVGNYSKAPIKTQFGWHVILVQERRRAKAPSMPHAMPKIQQEVTRQVLTDVIGSLRNGADIEIISAGGSLQRPGQR